MSAFLPAFTTAFWRTPVLVLCLVLGACGGGDDDAGTGPAAAPATAVGSAGGTVTGTQGARVSIPPGALAGNTLIGVAQTDTGAPPLTEGLSALGAMFAFTPHGTVFGVPATITLPFDPASVPAGRTPALYKTNAQNEWEQLASATFGADSVSAQVSGFSHAQVVLAPLQRNDPERAWGFVEVNIIGFQDIPAPQGRGLQIGGVLDQKISFGRTAFDGPPLTDGTSLPVDGQANGHIFASADGVSWSVAAEAPFERQTAVSAIGGEAQLGHGQSFIKRSDDARLSYTITRVVLRGVDFLPLALNEPANDVQAIVRVGVSARFGGDPSRPVFGRGFYSAGGDVYLSGAGDLWLPHVPPPAGKETALWVADNFDFSTRRIYMATGGGGLSDTPVAGGCQGTFAELKSKVSKTYEIDLSRVDKDTEFSVRFSASATAFNRRGGGAVGDCEGSAAIAFLRDPLNIGGSYSFAGLEPTNRPDPEPLTPELIPPESCVPGPAPDPAAGVLQFSAPAFTTGVLPGVPSIAIVRTGGSRGAVTATFATTDATAVGGTDYTPVRATVFFGDGEVGPKVMAVPIVQGGTLRPARTVGLSLSEPGACAGLGPQASAVLTIVDERTAPVLRFTIGGTVTGLVGGGLVLTESGADLPLSANGAFVLPRTVASQSAYQVQVRTQPTGPAQICMLANGSGTVGTANVGNVTVHCTAPPASGALDTSFGSAGRVTTGAAGGAVAMVLQGDGKSVLLGAQRTLTRYHVDGSIDTSFGTGGQVAVVFSGGAGDAAQALAIQPDGKLVVAGFTRVAGNDDFAVARYLPDGAADTAFGSAGKVSIDFATGSDQATAVLVQADGAIVVAGHAMADNTNGDNDFAVARLRADGALDLGFGQGGKTTTNIAGQGDLALAAVLQADGKIVLGGRVSNGGGPEDFGLTRYNANGTLDTGFGQGGKVRADMAVNGRTDQVTDLALQPDGKILAAGFAAVASSAPFGNSQAFALARFNADGSRDTGFGTGGLATASFSTLDDFGRALALQADGTIVVAGQSSNQSNPDFGIVRWTPRGDLDTSFGTNGRLTVDFFGSFDGARDIVVQGDGRLLVGGSAANGSSTGLGLIRISP